MAYWNKRWYYEPRSDWFVSFMGSGHWQSF